jgi:hypothetical protein
MYDYDGTDLAISIKSYTVKWKRERRASSGHVIVRLAISFARSAPAGRGGRSFAAGPWLRLGT